MTHIDYHLISNNHDEHKKTIEEVKSSVFTWEHEGDENIKIFKIETDEMNGDVILVDEHEIDLNDLKLL